MYKPNLNFCLPGEGRSKGQQGIDWSLCSWDKLFYLDENLTTQNSGEYFYLDENLTTENTGEYFYTFVLEISCSIWMRTSILRILVNISIPLFLRRVVLSWFEPQYWEYWWIFLYLCSWDKLFYLNENLTTQNTGKYPGKLSSWFSQP